MTCSQCFGRPVEIACLGLVGLLAAAGCQGSRDEKDDGGAAIDQKPLINANPGTVNLGHFVVGETSPPQAVTITNVGTVSATMAITPSPAGIIAVTGCATVLVAGASCVLYITATPIVAGSITGTVSVAVAGGNAVTVGVTATGIGEG